MTVQTKGNCRHGVCVTVVIEVAGMTTLAVFAADCTYRAAAERTIVQGIKVMTGVTGLSNMGFASTCVRYSSRSVAVQTESHCAHGMLGSSRASMLMTIEISGMTGCTGIGRAPNIFMALGTGSSFKSNRSSGLSMAGNTAAGAMDTVKNRLGMTAAAR